MALQAPSGSNARGWHFVVVGDEARKTAIADYYRTSNANIRGFFPTSRETDELLDPVVAYELKDPLGLLAAETAFHTGSYNEALVFEDWQGTPERACW